MAEREPDKIQFAYPFRKGDPRFEALAGKVLDAIADTKVFEWNPQRIEEIVMYIQSLPGLIEEQYPDLLREDPLIAQKIRAHISYDLYQAIRNNPSPAVARLAENILALSVYKQSGTERAALQEDKAAELTIPDVATDPLFENPLNRPSEGVVTLEEALPDFAKSFSLWESQIESMRKRANPLQILIFDLVQYHLLDTMDAVTSQAAKDLPASFMHFVNNTMKKTVIFLTNLVNSSDPSNFRRNVALLLDMLDTYYNELGNYRYILPVVKVLLRRVPAFFVFDQGILFGLKSAGLDPKSGNWALIKELIDESSGMAHTLTELYKKDPKAVAARRKDKDPASYRRLQLLFHLADTLRVSGDQETAIFCHFLERTLPYIEDDQELALISTGLQPLWNITYAQLDFKSILPEEFSAYSAFFKNQNVLYHLLFPTGKALKSEDYLAFAQKYPYLQAKFDELKKLPDLEDRELFVIHFLIENYISKALSAQQSEFKIATMMINTFIVHLNKKPGSHLAEIAPLPRVEFLTNPSEIL